MKAEIIMNFVYQEITLINLVLKASFQKRLVWSYLKVESTFLTSNF